jgi:hypothetical protein
VKVLSNCCHWPNQDDQYYDIRHFLDNIGYKLLTYFKLDLPRQPGQIVHKYNLENPILLGDRKDFKDKISLRKKFVTKLFDCFLFPLK